MLQLFSGRSCKALRGVVVQGRSTEPSLVTPAQRSEPPRSRTPQRPPPLDTSSPGLVRISHSKMFLTE